MKHKSKLLFFSRENECYSVLLGKRVVSLNESFWWLPGGSVDPEESPFEAAVREIFEEFIPDDEMEQVLAKYIKKHQQPPAFSYQSEHAFTTLFFVELYHKPVPQILDEFVELRWFPVSGLPENMSREYYFAKDAFSGLFLEKILTEKK